MEIGYVWKHEHADLAWKAAFGAIHISVRLKSNLKSSAIRTVASF